MSSFSSSSFSSSGSPSSPDNPPPPDPQDPSPPCNSDCHGGGSGSSGCSSDPVRYFNGELIYERTDLPTPLEGFGHSRVYNNRRGGAYLGPNGFNWFVWPYVLAPDPGDLSTLVVVLGADSIWFDDSGSGYVARYGMDTTYGLEHDAGSAVYRLTIAGEGGAGVIEFHDLDQTFYPHGILKERTDASGQRVTTVTAYLGDGWGIESMEHAVTIGTETRRYTLDYDYATDGRIDTATLSGESGEPLRRASYDYDGNDDLASVAVEEPDGAGGWSAIAGSHYRYYGSGEAGGFAHGLKYAVEPAAYGRMVAGGLDPQTATEAELDAYATHYFEYDDDENSSRYRAVTKEVARNLPGGSGTAGERFTRTENPSYPTDPDKNTWRWKVERTGVDGIRELIYTNAEGQVMLRVTEPEEGSGGSSSSSGSSPAPRWHAFNKYDGAGRKVLEADPSAITGYDEALDDLLGEQSGGSHQYLRDNAGLIRRTEYYDTTTADATTPGGVAGKVRLEKVQEGQNGSEVKLRELTYFRQTAGGKDFYPLAERIAYPDEADDTKTITTSYGYEWYSGPTRMKQRTTTLPAVPTSQNGDGTGATRKERFDERGRLAWSMDERGFITRFQRDDFTGDLIRRIDDVDTALTSDEPTGWSTPGGGGAHRVTDYRHDWLGRWTQALGPEHEAVVGGAAATVRTAKWAVYREGVESDETWTGRGYDDGTDQFLVEPVAMMRTDKNGRSTDAIESKRTTGSGRLSESDTFDQGDWTRWTHHDLDAEGQRTATRIYHDIPSSGDGAPGTNYDEAAFAYDPDTRRKLREQSPGGSVMRTVYDDLNRPVALWSGTDDTDATAEDPTGGGASGNDMVLVSERAYDDDRPLRDQVVAQIIEHVDGAVVRITDFAYDFRHRRIVTDGEEDYYQKLAYDNLNRVIKSEGYDTDETGNLVGREETFFDDRNRVYRTKAYAVDPDTGTIGNALTGDSWYDAAGNLVRSIAPGAGAVFTALEYDGLGRLTETATGYDDGGDVIAERTTTAFDEANNVLVMTHEQRDTDASTVRVTYRASWYDGVGRRIASADYGTNGGSAFTRPATPPARSDTVLVSSTVYGDAGDAARTTDPRGIEMRTERDDAGRVVRKIENHTDGDPATGSADEDRVTEFTHNADGRTETITAVNGETGDQVTTYVYGTTLGDSDLASNELLRAIEYPDSTGSSDRVEMTYNRQGDITTRTDQAGTTHAYDYDGLGRQTQDRITALGSGVDGSVRRIETAYHVQMMVDRVTSYDDPAAGGVVNEVEPGYNGFRQLVSERQAHGGAVGASTPEVQYAYASGTGNHTRPASITYPDGRAIGYDYGASGSMDDALNRVATITDGGGSLVDYRYLGLGRVVRADLTEPGVRLDLWGGTAGSYAGLDRFGRVVDQRWFDYNGSMDVDRVKHGYDRSSNRLWRENVTADLHGGGFDELYSYDGLNRLVDFQRGDLNSTKDGINSKAFAQDWNLDPVGNWSSFREDSDGDGTDDLIQARDHNPANEITDVTGWAAPAHDAAGNMISMPQPGDPANSYTATYDAWNRLVKLEDGADTVAEYQYDGRKRRIVKKTYDASGVLEETRHCYYSDDWRVLEERVGASTDADRQFVWGVRYVDELVLRDRDTTGDGALDERLYALQDANFNVTTLLDTGGSVAERFAYDAYGDTTVFTASFGARSASSYGWETRYAGYRHDAESGLHHVRNRVLHPLLGRWVQRDPMGYADGMNLYEYVMGSPMIHLDPEGARARIIIIIVRACKTIIKRIFSKPRKLKKSKKPCPPCPSPTFRTRTDRVPPSRPHYPCPSDHWHYQVKNQNPKTCQCFWGSWMFGGCL